MCPELKEIQVEGVVSQKGNQYTITTDDGIQYNLSAIMPWEAVAPGYRIEGFTLHAGRRVIATGMTDGCTIWKAQLGTAVYD
jgi:hypothetical protein